MTYQCFLVDDDSDDLKIFALAMEEVDSSIQCVTATNGVEALEKLRDEEFIPDVIFLDLNMPRMNGKQCLIEMKKIDRLKDVPVIMYSTSSDRRDVEETLHLGAAHFLTKPSNISALTKSLTELLTCTKN